MSYKGKEKNKELILKNDIYLNFIKYLTYIASFNQ